MKPSLLLQISKDFFDWWQDLGNVEFKSEIKRPEDIEALFQVYLPFKIYKESPFCVYVKTQNNCPQNCPQVWFDEHASRGLMLDPKIIPCVLQSIADYAGAPEVSTFQTTFIRQLSFG